MDGWEPMPEEQNRRQASEAPNPSIWPPPSPHPERAPAGTRKGGAAASTGADAKKPPPSRNLRPDTTAATLPSPNPAVASLPTSLPHGRDHQTLNPRILRRCGAPRRRARAARTRLLRGVHHRCMDIRYGAVRDWLRRRAASAARTLLRRGGHHR
jgi:hypothetical protein